MRKNQGKGGVGVCNAGVKRGVRGSRFALDANHNNLRKCLGFGSG